MSTQDDIAHKIAVEMFGEEGARLMEDKLRLRQAAPAQPVFAAQSLGGYAVKSPTGSVADSMPQIPQEIAQFLGQHGSLNDSLSGEPVAWGWPVVAHMGEVLFEEAKAYGQMVFDHGGWFLIYRFLTRQEAIQKYGAVTAEEHGPRGGWKSVTFGQTLFKHKCLKPSK